MPLQRSYDVNCVEGGDAPRRTSPYPGSWIFWLIGFFALCILILVVCLVQRGSSDQPEAQKSGRIQAERPDETGTSTFDLSTTPTQAASANPTGGTTEPINNSSSKNSTNSSPGPTGNSVVKAFTDSTPKPTDDSVVKTFTDSTPKPTDDFVVKTFTDSTPKPTDDSVVETFTNSTRKPTDDSVVKAFTDSTPKPTDDSVVKAFTDSTPKPTDDSVVKTFTDGTPKPTDDSVVKTFTDSTPKPTDDFVVKTFTDSTPKPTDDSVVKAFTDSTPKPTDDSVVKAFTDSTPKPTDDSVVETFTNSTPKPTDDSVVKAFTDSTPKPTDDSVVKAFTDSTPKPTDDSVVETFTNSTPKPTDDSVVKAFTDSTPKPTDDSVVETFTNSTPKPTDDSVVETFTNSTPKPTDDSVVKAFTDSTPKPTDDSVVETFTNSTPKPTNDSVVETFTNSTPKPTDDSVVKAFTDSTPKPTDDSVVETFTNSTPKPTDDSVVKAFTDSTPKPTDDSVVETFTNSTPKPTDDFVVETFTDSTPKPTDDSVVKTFTDSTPKPTEDSLRDIQHESAHNGVESHFGSRVASQMLFYMNHSADTCGDFYEYACGGFEANHLMSENDLAEQAAKRIFDQAKMEKTSGRDTEFQDYYQSCVTYYKNSTESQRIEFAKKAISEVGKFYGVEEWKKGEHSNLTTMLSKLFLRNSAPLFDITADIAVDDQINCADQARATKFTWKLSPPVLGGNSYRDKRERDCYNLLSSAMLKKDVNLRELHKNYTSCKNDLENFLDSVEEAMKLSDLDDQDIKSVRYGIDFDLMPEFYKTYPEVEKSRNNPTEGEIHHSHLTKNYTMMTIEELQSALPADDPFLDWKQLLRTLKGSTVDFEQPLQVYFPDVILKGLKNLSNLIEGRDLHNAILALHAHKIYYEFVVPPPDVEAHCKRVATSLMGTQASSLYMSSFSSEELADMKEMVMEVFGELKETLESGLANASWLGPPAEKEIVTKVQDLTIEIPDASCYQNDHKLNPENSQVKRELTGEFVHDTMVLQKNYRKSMYEVLDKSPSDYEQIWTHFGLPYQTRGSAIYELNKIVMPYGAIDWSNVRNAKKMSSRHLVLATLGTRIADLMAHHLDSTGVEYFAGRRNKDYLAVFCSNEARANTYRAYVEHTKSFADHFEHLFLSSTEQNVSYKMTDLSLNERISSAIGLQLAYDTMSRLPSESKKLLPWLTNESKTDERKQFFLAYAQMHCTKVPFTSSFVSLDEKEHLPSRLRILAAAASSEALGSTWECEDGSNVRPGDAPSRFPHLNADEG